MSELAVQHLLAEQRPDGGWGAYPAAESRTESTALCTLALRTAMSSGFGGDALGVGAAVAAGTEWLLSRQAEGGGWPVGDDVPGEGWPTSLVALALADHEPAREHRRRAGLWLLAQEGRGSPWWVRWLYRLAPERRTVALDPDLTGWPWVDGTFSWVEPTSYALVALKRLRSELPPARTDERIEEAERMLLDRVCPGGGWNYGNSEVFGDSLWPYPDTTALALLALADRPAEPAVEEGSRALEQMLVENDSILALGLGLLALRTLGRPTADLEVRLGARIEAWRDGGLRDLGWATLALGGGADPLGVRGA